jgi:hypothetical protein
MSECPFPVKRSFRTRALARIGMGDIRDMVQARGDQYNTLYPYRCGNH